MSAAVIEGDEIDQRHLVDLHDVVRTIPGVTHQDYGAGRTTTVVRGISADPQEGVETTGVYLNEAPLTNLSDRGRSTPEVKLVDVERVEILRGPQGTLYGSSSLGGTVRAITAKPRLDRPGGRLSATLSQTAEDGGSNRSVQGVANLPVVEDEFAVRVVGFAYDNSGFYRNVAASDPEKSASAARTGGLVLDRSDVGESTYAGGRIAARWAPSDVLDVNLMFMQQRIEQEGVPYGDLRIDAFRQARYTRFSSRRGEYNEDDLRIVNLDIDYDFGPVALLSSTSVIDYEHTEDWDVGQFWTFFYEDDAPIYLFNTTVTDRLAQELRLHSQWDHPVHFLAGIYFEDTDSANGQRLDWAGDPAADPLGGDLLFRFDDGRTFEQIALFGEATWDVTEWLAATLGVRWFDYEVGFQSAGDGFFAGGPFNETLLASEDGQTFKINLSYLPDEETLYYAQWAQGFNPGSPLGGFPDICDADGDGLIDGLGLAPQAQLLSETMDSYEAGAKLRFAGGRVDVRTAAYYNRWDNIPIALTGDCGSIFLFNAAEATTAGLEVEGSALLGPLWRLDFSAGYTKAELASDAPGLGVDGDRLPGTPQFNAMLGAQYDFVWRDRDGYLRVDVARVSEFYNNLQEAGRKIGDYTTIGLAAGLALERWDVKLFVHNLTNEDAATWISKFDEYPSAFRLRPRTIGVSVAYRAGAVE